MNRLTNKKNQKLASAKKNKQILSMANKMQNTNTFTKIYNASTVVGNNSVITQRNSSCSKSKMCSVNPQSQCTVRRNSTQRKTRKVQTMIGSDKKTDRKLQYTKQKAKQLNNLIEKKSCLNEKSIKKRSKSAYNTGCNTKNDNDNCDKQFHKVQINSNLKKISNFLKEGTQKITEIKRSSDSFILKQMDKTQKQLIQRISLLENENKESINKKNMMLDELKIKFQSKIIQSKQQVQYLNLKVDQQNNKNITLEKKIESYQKDFMGLRQKIQQKDHLISKLNEEKVQHANQKLILQEQNKNMKQVIKGFQLNLNNMKQNSDSLKKQKTLLEQELRKCQKEKQYIKENSIQVLAILREEFGEQLKLFNR